DPASLAVNSEDRSKVVAMLKRLGVHVPQPDHIIDHHILPRHVAADFKGSTAKAMIGHIAYVRSNLEEYLSLKTQSEHSWNKAKARSQHLDALSKGLRIQTASRQAVRTYAPACNVYLGKDYGNRYDIE